MKFLKEANYTGFVQKEQTIKIFRNQHANFYKNEGPRTRFQATFF